MNETLLICNVVTVLSKISSNSIVDLFIGGGQFARWMVRPWPSRQRLFQNFGRQGGFGLTTPMLPYERKN